MTRMPQRFTEDEIAAEEERIGGRLPDELRRRYLDGPPNFALLTGEDEVQTIFFLWGPSRTVTDKKGRQWPTPGMAKETQSYRESGDGSPPDDVLVAWGYDDGSADLAVVLRNGTLAWWRNRDGELVPSEVDWDPSDELLEQL
jgi:hypothetical protein